MKKLLTIIATFAISVAAFGASIDGTWTMQQRAKEKDITVTFQFKAAGTTLNGTMMKPGKKARSVSIQNGKVEGDKFSFETVATSKKKGDVRTKWSGSVGETELNGRRRADTGKGKGAAFTMKKAS